MDFFLVEADPTSEAAVQADLSFHLGTAVNLGKVYATQVGWEDIVVIASASNPLDRLSSDQLLALFSRRVKNWEELSPAPKGLTGEVYLWTYPQGDEIRRAFEIVSLQGGSSSAQPMLAPDPQAMLEAVGADPDAVGYIPRSWMANLGTEPASKLKVITLDSNQSQALHLPVLAVSPLEPQGSGRALLVCLEGK